MLKKSSLTVLGIGIEISILFKYIKDADILCVLYTVTTIYYSSHNIV